VKRPHPNPVVHLELHTGDAQRARSFYADLCGWRSEQIVAGLGSYLALDMGAGPGGGMVECTTQHSLWLPYVQVDDVAAATQRALELGAKALLSPREGPAGWRSVVSAPAGAEIAFWQPKEHHR
jgi:predicted enzyme related to lactoylglutathione lyase